MRTKFILPGAEDTKLMEFCSGHSIVAKLLL